MMYINYLCYAVVSSHLIGVTQKAKASLFFLEIHLAHVCLFFLKAYYVAFPKTNYI